MRTVLTILLLVLSTHLCLSQNEHFCIQHDSIALADLFQEIQSKTNLTFQYAPEWVNHTVYQIDYCNEPLEEVLEDLAAKNDLDFVIRGNKVVFTYRQKIKTNFNAEYEAYKKELVLLKDTTNYQLSQREVDQDLMLNDEYRLITLGSRSVSPYKRTATLHGFVRDSESGEFLVGTVIYIENLNKNAVTNSAGFYSLTLPKGRHRVFFRTVGMKLTSRNIDLLSDGELSISLDPMPTSLQEVTIVAQSNDNVKSLTMGIEKLTSKALKQLPLGMGEPDVIKSTLMLPGVQSVGEAASGFNVRGGSSDQNLILLNGAPIMNSSHFFGFFSGFNTDVIKDVTLYKSGIPSQFGGRISSVLDINLKEGNRKQYKAYGGISPVSGRFTFEGPLIKDKASIIVAGRSTYSDWILRLLNDVQLQKSRASFNDFHSNISYDLNENNSFNLTGYYSHDRFDLYQNDAYDYNSLAATLQWKHIFSPRLFSSFYLTESNYNYLLKSRDEVASAFSMYYAINQVLSGVDFNFYPSPKHKIDFGLGTTVYSLKPGKREPLDSLSVIIPKELEHENALETALYIDDEIKLSSLLSVSLGLRYAFYFLTGPKTLNLYEEGLPLNSSSYIGSKNYSWGQLVKFYSAPALNASANYRLPFSSSVKLSYNRMYQFIHMISNSTSSSPTDIWKLSDPYLKPQLSDQVSLGLYRNFNSNTIETSVEVYYKFLHNIIDYKGGALLLMNDHLETDLLSGAGKAYGLELMLRKKSGQLSGWISYAYARVFHQVNGAFEEELINQGSYFPANYDKPHELKLVANYKFTRRFNISSNFIYSTGRPFTVPITYYQFNQSQQVFFSDRNQYRMPDYIRLDCSATVNGNLLAKKLNHSSLTFAVYNVLGRKNPYSIYFKKEDDQINGYQLSIFARPIFTLTYNFKLFGNAKDDF